VSAQGTLSTVQWRSRSLSALVWMSSWDIPIPGCHLGWRREALWRSGRVDRLTPREDLGDQPAHGAGGQRQLRSSQCGPATGTGLRDANPSDSRYKRCLTPPLGCVCPAW
jgi:hypothetical protein